MWQSTMRKTERWEEERRRKAAAAAAAAAAARYRKQGRQTCKVLLIIITQTYSASRAVMLPTSGELGNFSNNCPMKKKLRKVKMKMDRMPLSHRMQVSLLLTKFIPLGWLASLNEVR
jgi:hypothetical protein